MSDTIAATEAGLVRGVRLGPLSVFRGIPYAAAPVGDRRWRAPVRVDPWSGVRDALVFAPSAPQRAARLDAVYGTVDGPHDEDCLYLNVWTPCLDDARRPVFVWFHGGAFVTGSAAMPGYDGSRLATDGDIVVVTVNYRLGPLGFLYVPADDRATGEANFGISDQVAALQWVRRNIVAFGGDANRVTIAGQSAGGASVAAHLTLPPSRSLFARAILQSAPLGVAAHTRASAEGVTARFVAAAGVADASALRALPVDRLLDAAATVTAQTAGFADGRDAFRLVVDGTTLRDDPVTVLESEVGADVDVLVGTTREELAAFVAQVDRLEDVDRDTVVTRLRQPFGDRADRAYEVYARTHPAARPCDVLVDAVTDELFRRPALRFAEARHRHGHPTFVYQFDWPSRARGGRLAAADPVFLDRLADVVHRSWIAFIRTGSPNHDGLPTWDAYDPAHRTTMLFDTLVTPVHDAARAVRSVWPE